MSDVVSGLLAKLDSLERAAQDAVNHARGGEWSEAARRPAQWGEAEQDVDMLSGGKPVATFHVEYGGAFAAEHAIGNDPQSILRLCRAHRDIIDEWRQAQAAADADPVDVSARIGAFSFMIALRVLARGLGVEEQSSE